jgi:TonB-dependent starch-binding outer membrane protein SusC
MRKIVCMLSLMLLFTGVVFAQTKTITGTVTDEAGLPLVGATVKSNVGRATAKTNAQGSFTLVVPNDAKTVSVTYVGFASTSQQIGAGNNVTFSLVKATQQEETVVLTGYSKRKKKDEAGAITTIKGSDINDQAVQSLDKALQGAAPGVTVQANNGIPGGNIRVNIRGLSSFGSGTAPLWVIDGIPFPTGSISNNTQTNPLAFINQSDIETIDILKDAASTAIYGSSGANGVILVTTKKGRNQKTRIGFNTYRGRSSPLKLMNTTSIQDYFKFRMEAVNNNYNTTNAVPLTEQALKSTTLNGIEANLTTGLSTAQISAMTVPQLDSLIGALPNTDWQSTVFRPGDIANYELTLNGGTDKTQFYTSLSLQDAKSIINKTDFKRVGLKVDVTNQATDKLKINFNAFLSSTYQNAPFATDGSFLGNPAFSAPLVLPHNPIYNRDGSYFSIAPGKNLAGLLSHNVVAVNDYNTGFDDTKQAVSNVTLEYKLAKWLTLRSTGGIDYRANRGRLFRDPRTPDGAGVQGRTITTANYFTNLITNHALVFQKAFGSKHNIDGVAGYEYIKRTSEGFSGQKTGFTTYQLPLLTAGGTVVSADEYKTDNIKSSVFGNINYNYDRRYSVGATLRRDGSSRFGESNRFGTFWSTKAVWNIDREAFWTKMNKAVSTFRVRASYGVVGNDNIGDFDALGTYASGPIYNGAPAIFANRLASSSLTWETVKETNLGLDLGFARDRITLSIDVYKRITNGILQNVDLPRYTGWTSVRQNTGELENRGIEIGFVAKIIDPERAEAFRWSVGVNYAYNDNKILNIINGTNTLDRNTSVLLGKPIGQVLTNKYGGVNASNGKPFWLDSLGNPTYLVVPKDRYYAGIGANGLPPVTGGFNSTMSFRGITLDAQFAFQYGQIISDGQYNFAMETQGRVNTIYENFDNRWTTPGQITTIPRANTAAEQNNTGPGGGDRFLQKTDMIRLRSLTLSYDFARGLLQKLKVNNARFYLQGGNLWTYTAFKGYDPEFVTTATGIVPQSKNFTVGFNIGF